MIYASSTTFRTGSIKGFPMVIFFPCCSYITVSKFKFASEEYLGIQIRRIRTGKIDTNLDLTLLM